MAGIPPQVPFIVMPPALPAAPVQGPQPHNPIPGLAANLHNFANQVGVVQNWPPFAQGAWMVNALQQIYQLNIQLVNSFNQLSQDTGVIRADVDLLVRPRQALDQ